MRNYNQPPTFREVAPIAQWSARIGIDVPYDEFEQITLAAAADRGHRYKGVLTRDQQTQHVTSFTHTRFARNKYGPPPEIADCEMGMDYLAAQFGVVQEREILVPGISRAIVGLYEGQHASGARLEPDGADYSIEEVSRLLGPDYHVRPGEVFSVRLEPDGTPSYYAEEIADIRFLSRLKPSVYQLADRMRQERLSIEEFAGPDSMAYMVETRWCTDPDPDEPVLA